MLIIEQAYQKSLELMKKNSAPYGFVAATRSDQALERGYYAVFARDAMICALAAISSENKDLLQTAQKSLFLLANNSDSRGQIPFCVNLEKKLVKFRIPRSIDSTVWWLIVFWLLTEKLGDKSLKASLQENFEKSLNWLHYYLNYGLLEQGEGGDWANEMPRSGLVLFSNALWLIFLNLINSKEKIQIYKNFTYFFSTENISSPGFGLLDKQFPFWRKNKQKFLKKNKYFLASVSRVTVDESLDVLGNVLACISGLLPQTKVRQIISEIKKAKSSSPIPIRTQDQPISKSRQGIFEQQHQNKPWHYHNGGAWPMAGGFWVYLLAQQGEEKLARQELTKLAEANFVNNWEFNEWFHGKTGRPQGVKYQTWNAATYILAYNALINKKFII